MNDLTLIDCLKCIPFCILIGMMLWANIFGKKYRNNRDSEKD